MRMSKLVFRVICLAAVSALAAACATGRPTGQEMTYLCDDQKVVRVFTSVDANQAELLTLVLPDGSRATLVNVIAASGAKYVGGIYEWWSKGDQASFSYHDQRLECTRQR